MVGAILFRINRSYSVYVRHRRDIGRKLLGVVECFPDFNMAMIFHFLGRPLILQRLVIVQVALVC